MDHLFHKNILQEKHNLEWQLAEANKKIEQLQRTISSLQEKKLASQDGTITWQPPLPNWHPYRNDPRYPEPFQGKDGRWYSPNPNPTYPEPQDPWGAPPAPGDNQFQDDGFWGPGPGDGPTVG